jgi:SAM-dependent methyltransferase
MPFTGERLTSALTGETEIEHLHRYLYARELCREKDVLDVASGEGYGSALLAQVATSVVGLEIAADAVEHARGAYQRKNLRFVQGDARKMELPAACVDVVVSFETIEHFAEQEEFLKEVRRVLRPGGMFVVSTPDRDHYSPAEAPANPYHALELTQQEFSALLARHFAHVSCLLQRPLIGSLMLPAASGSASPPALCFERRGKEHFEASQGLARPRYVIALASDREISSLPATAYVETSRLGYLTAESVDATHREMENIQRELEAEKARAAHELETEKTRAAAVVQELRRLLEHSNSERAVLVSTNERAQQACTLMRQQLASVQQELVACQQQVSNKHREIDLLHASTSWRVTAPLRAVKSRFRRRRP